MAPVPPQTVQIQCPACGHPFQTQVHSIVDVTQQPELKQMLLGGQLNLAVCPHCGQAVMLGRPLVYHDADKQLCLVFVPQELKLTAEQEERFIGDATAALIQSLPAETPRGHLLTPRRVMSLSSLVDTILEADGIPREALEQQHRQIELISRLAETLPNDEQFGHVVEQHRAEMTPEFFAVLNAFLQASTQEGRGDSAQMLHALREKLAAYLGVNADSSPGDAELQPVIERLATVSDEELPEAIAEARHFIDYAFFQAWTAHIDELEQAGQADEARRLTERRTVILDMTEQMDREAQALFEAGSRALREVLEAENMRAAVEALGERVDEAFMLVLSSNIAAAQRAGQAEVVARLEAISQFAIDAIQARLSPEERLINELMQAETPQESTSLLRKQAAQITPAFVKKLNELADEQEKRGIKPNAEQLRRLAREAGAMLF